MKPLPQLIHGSKILAKAMNIDMFNCPLFLWEDDQPYQHFEYISDLVDIAHEKISKYPIPFNEMRVLFKMNMSVFDEEGSAPYESKFYYFLFIQKTKCPNTERDAYFCLGQWIGNEQVTKDGAIAFHIFPHTSPNRKCFINVSGYSWKRKEIEILKEEDQFKFAYNRQDEQHSKDDVGRRMASHCGVLFWGAAKLIESIAQKDKRIVEVTPNPNAREVQWLEGRKHYVVLSNREAIEKCSQPMELKACEVITRIAHSRRAHTRTLRSERFKNKKGLTVFVKEHWVGPKEWMDKSQSRYRVIFN